MGADEKQVSSQSFILRVAGFTVPNEKQGELEKSAKGMADLADSLGFLDPFDEDPALVFFPRV